MAIGQRGIATDLAAADTSKSFVNANQPNDRCVTHAPDKPLSPFERLAAFKYFATIITRFHAAKPAR
jgi:hypothetical protein